MQLKVHPNSNQSNHPTFNKTYLEPENLEKSKSKANEMREELTRVSRGLIETARVRTSSSFGFRSGISTSWRTSSTSGPPNRGKTTALQVVAMLLIPRFVEAWRNLASAADLPETESLLHTVILSIQGFLDALETLIPYTKQISVLRR